MNVYMEVVEVEVVVVLAVVSQELHRYRIDGR